jgi:two-component system sensor histidine kinase KdpD
LSTWFAVYVERGIILTPPERRQVATNLDLARSFGATVISAIGPDLNETLLRLARQENVSRLILGKASLTSGWRYWKHCIRRNQLIEKSGDLEITFVPLAPSPSKVDELFPFSRAGWREWMLALGILAVITVVGVLIEKTIGYPSVPPIFFLTLILSALFLGRWPVMMLAFSGTLAWWFFILPQRFSLRIHHLEDALMLALFFVTALVSGHLASLLRSRERGGLEGEKKARTLYDLLRGLNENRDFEIGGLESAIAKVESVFQAKAALMRPSPEGGMMSVHPAGQLQTSPPDLVLAQWSLQNRKWAGQMSDQFMESPITFVPLYSGGKPRGVLAVQLADGESWDTLQRELMESMAGLLAQMMEREENARQAQMTGIAVESQKMQRALLDNFSHEMHTPISVLASALQHLRQQQPSDPETRIILQEARIAVDRLTLVVREMTNLAQIDCGTLRPSLEWCDTADFLQEWLDAKKEAFAEQRIRLSLPERTVYIRVDTRLLTTALDNIFNNARRHAPEGTPIDVHAETGKERLRIDISDQGPGIPPEQRDRIFERFYRGPGELPGGMGLGLPVARQFAELMDGTLNVDSHYGKGACFTFSFPCTYELSLTEDMNP